MNDHLEQALAAALDELAERAPSDRLDPRAIRRRAVRQRLALFGIPLVAIMIIASAIAVGVSSRHQSAVVAGPPPASVCAPLRTDAPPQWARGGFTGSSYPPYATSSSGDVVALIFGQPLTAPPSTDHNNKILWVVRDGATLAGSKAQLEGTGKPTKLSFAAGPSIVNMPAAGCWHLELLVGNRRDSINLRWAPR